MVETSFKIAARSCELKISHQICKLDDKYKVGCQGIVKVMLRAHYEKDTQTVTL